MAYGRRTLARFANEIERNANKYGKPVYIFFGRIFFVDDEGNNQESYGNYLSKKRKWALARLGRHLGHIDPEMWINDPWRTVGEVVAKLRASAGIGYWGAGIQ